MPVACLCALLFLALLPQTVHADAGPKPTVTVQCSNMPVGQQVYLDLLIEDPPLEAGAGFTLGGADEAQYDAEMLETLRQYSVDGWRPALATGTGAPLWGELRCGVQPDGTASSTFSYFGLPDRFKVIAVSEDGAVAVSGVVERKAFESTVAFDYAAQTARERNVPVQLAGQLALTLAVTLLVEGLMLLLFRFSFQLNWKPFLFVNLGTQFALYALIAFATYNLGALFGVLAYLFAEWLILVAETLLFVALLKGQSKLRRAVYGITANLASFVAGMAIAIVYAAL